MGVPPNLSALGIILKNKTNKRKRSMKNKTNKKVSFSVLHIDPETPDPVLPLRFVHSLRASQLEQY